MTHAAGQARPPRRLRARLRRGRGRSRRHRRAPSSPSARSASTRRVGRRPSSRWRSATRSSAWRSACSSSAFATTEFQAVQFMPAVVLPPAAAVRPVRGARRDGRRAARVSAVLPLTYAFDAIDRVTRDGRSARGAPWTWRSSRAARCSPSRSARRPSGAGPPDRASVPLSGVSALLAVERRRRGRTVARAAPAAAGLGGASVDAEVVQPLIGWPADGSSGEPRARPGPCGGFSAVAVRRTTDEVRRSPAYLRSMPRRPSPRARPLERRASPDRRARLARLRRRRLRDRRRGRARSRSSTTDLGNGESLRRQPGARPAVPARARGRAGADPEPQRPAAGRRVPRRRRRPRRAPVAHAGGGADRVAAAAAATRASAPRTGPRRW